MEFMMLRDRMVTSVFGHSIEFKKGVPTHVPPALYAEVLAAGGVPKEELPEEDASKVVEPSDPHVRSEKIQVAIAALVERGKREDFTANGSPHPKALSVELGWPVASKERDAEWARFQADRD
jgi:hypothetical protein